MFSSLPIQFFSRLFHTIEHNSSLELMLLGCVNPSLCKTEKSEKNHTTPSFGTHPFSKATVKFKKRSCNSFCVFRG